MSRRRMRRLAPATALIGTALVLADCAETTLVAHLAKELAGTTTPATPRGVYKVGEPYQIDGAWYWPQEDFAYDQTGIASWYGPDFHGEVTANGEVFDQEALTAAHPTAPHGAAIRSDRRPTATPKNFDRFHFISAWKFL